ncbi:hypothetical protein DFH06DRAFT_1302100 [Mycena polygramma]|nr:hypothetical protein DFH06DRAFT_1302100 [Mycena polygramma]
MHASPVLLVALAALGASAQSSSRSVSASVSGSGSASSVSSVSGSNSIGTPSNSAALPSLSGVSSCVTNCLAMAASADGCESVAAVDCFCPQPKNYTSTFLTCLTACPSEVPSAEALVEQFCAAAATPTSLSFASFNPSATPSSLSTSLSVSGSKSGSASRSGTGSSASQTAPSSAATTSNAAAAVRGMGMGGVPLLPLALMGAGMLMGALAVL